LMNQAAFMQPVCRIGSMDNLLAAQWL
jgi:hypothetical protein